MKKRLIIGATGASGIPILIQCLKLVQEQKDFESYLVMTDSAKLTLEHETKMKVEEVENLLIMFWIQERSVQDQPVDHFRRKGCSLSHVV